MTIDQLDIQLTADASKASRALTSLIKKLEQLKGSTDGLKKININVSNSFNKTTNSIKKTGTETEKTANKTKKASNSFKSFTDNVARSISKTRTLVGALKSTAAVFADLWKESNDYIETMNLFNITMGSGADAAIKYAEKVQSVMGIDIGEWAKNQGTFKALTAGFGVATDKANVMSQQLTQLTYDLASFYNTSTETAFDKLSSAMAGQVKGLREFGIDTTVASLQQYALSKGINASVSAMSQGEKALLRYNLILEKAQQIGATGDMARTLTTPANALRILNSQLTVMKRELGNIVSVLVTQFIPWVQAGVQLIAEWARSIAKAFGFDAKDFDFSKNANNMSDSFGVAEENLEDMQDKAKKLKKQLMGFDELNILSNPDSSSSSDSSSNSSSVSGMGVGTYDFLGKVDTTKMEEIKDKLKEILKYVGLVAVGLAAWKISKGLFSTISLLQAMLANPVYMITISAILTIAGLVITGMGIKDALENGVSGINFAEILGGGLLTAGGSAMLGAKLATWIAKAFGSSKITLWLTQAGINMGVGTYGAVGAALAAGVSGIIVGIPTMFVGIKDAIEKGINWLNGILIPAGATAAGAGIGAIIGACGGPIGAGIGALIGLAVGAVTDLVILIVQKWDVIVAWCSQACADIGQFFKDLWNGIVSVWNTVSEWFNTNVIQPVVGFFTGMWKGISTTASNCWDSIVEFFSPAIEWFSKLFGSIWQTISDVFYNIGVIAKGCWDIIKAVWKIVSGWFNTNVITPVKNFFAGLWNGVKTAAINAWNGMKSVFSTIGNWINTNIVMPVSGFFSGLWNGFKEGAKRAWEGVKSVFSTVGTFFQNTFEKAWKGIVKVFSIAGEIFVDIKDGIVSAFKFVVNGIIKGINKVVSIPFNGINSALGWLKNLEILNLKPFKDLKSINVPQIPLLADGGMVPAGQMFIAREAGPEMVGSIGNKTAVANNDQIVEGITRGVYNAMMAANGNGGKDININATFTMDGDVVGKKVIKYHNGVVMQTGASPLLV